MSGKATINGMMWVELKNRKCIDSFLRETKCRRRSFGGRTLAFLVTVAARIVKYVYRFFW